jgi:signal transduction histidine kinase
MRALIFALRPGSLEKDGLGQALRTYAAAVEQRSGLRITVAHGLEDRLPATVEDALYRIAQEALHNVVKHASARHVDISVARDGETVRLSVADDGSGFDESRVPSGHLGVAGMRARVGLVGGTLELRSEPGQGTSIEVRIPISGAIAAAPA